MEKITICEVAPRDGLQNEKSVFTASDKIKLIGDMEDAGINYIEVGSFVSPKAVPAMADTDKVCAGVEFSPQGSYTGLVLNEKGLERAKKAGLNGVCIVVVVSESLSLKNSRRSREESLATAVKLIQQAKDEGMFIRVDLAPAWVCPYEGAMDINSWLPMADTIWEMNIDELALADTIGHAHPMEVAKTFETLKGRYDISRLVAHFHDTQAMGLANAAAAMQVGVRRFD